MSAGQSSLGRKILHETEVPPDELSGPIGETGGTSVEEAGAFIDNYIAKIASVEAIFRIRCVSRVHVRMIELHNTLSALLEGHILSMWEEYSAFVDTVGANQKIAEEAKKSVIEHALERTTEADLTLTERYNELVSFSRAWGHDADTWGSRP